MYDQNAGNHLCDFALIMTLPLTYICKSTTMVSNTINYLRLYGQKCTATCASQANALGPSLNNRLEAA